MSHPLPYTTGKTYRYIPNKKTYTLEHITPQPKGLLDFDRVLYLSKQGEPMMSVPLVIADQFLEPHVELTPVLPEDEGIEDPTHEAE